MHGNVMKRKRRSLKAKLRGAKKRRRALKSRSLICLSSILRSGAGQHSGQDSYTIQLKKAPKITDWD